MFRRLVRDRQARHFALVGLLGATFASAAATLAACTAPPPPDEHVGATASALDPNQVIPSTSYVFQIDSIDVVTAVSVPANMRNANDLPYFVDWAELGVRVNDDNPAVFGCDLGPANPGTTIGNCQPGAIANGAYTQKGPLNAMVTVTSPSDVVNVALVLDNIEGASPTGGVDTTLNNAFAAGAAGTAAIGGVATLAAGSTASGASWAAGPIIGVIGSAASLIITLDPPGGGNQIGGPPFTMISCAGGLMGVPNPIPSGLDDTGFLDTMYQTFTASQLEALTAAGPAYLEYDPSVAAPGSTYCSASHRIHVSITRQWGSGPAAFAKSADSAVVETENGLEHFTTFGGQIEHDSLSPQGTWSTEYVPNTGLTSLANAGQPIAAVSRTSGVLDVFYVDDGGNVEWATQQGGSWQLNMSQGVAASPSSPITATARTPGNLDLFWVGPGGTMTGESLAFSGGSLAAAAGTVPAVPAPAGAGVAAVSRNPNDVDLFFVGSDGGVQWLTWNGSSWSSSELPGTAGLAPPGANVTAVAPTSASLDVFFVGKSGQVWTSTWYSGSPSFSTYAITSTGGAIAGEPVSAVSRQVQNTAPGATSTLIDVAYVAGHQVQVASWLGATALSIASQWTVTAASPSNVYVAYEYPVSIVAPSAWSAAVTYQDAFGGNWAQTTVLPSNAWSAATELTPPPEIYPGTFGTTVTVTGISETTGHVGDSVTVTGTGFSTTFGDTIIDFGTGSVHATCASTTSCTVPVPAAGASRVYVTATVGGVTSLGSSSAIFTYEAPSIASLSPSSGPTTGGQSITITGVGLDPSMTVFFGSTAVSGTANVGCASSTSCSVTAPPSGAGSVELSVAVSGVASAATPYTYLYLPVAETLGDGSSVMWTGSTPIVTVTLSEPAAYGGTVVTLTAGGTWTGVTFPATVTVPSYATSATFPVTVAANATGALALTAAAPGGNALMRWSIVPGNIYIAPTLTVTPGESISIPVYVRNPASAPGGTITATSSGTDLVLSETSVPLASGASTANLTGTTANTAGDVTLTVSYEGNTASAEVEIVQPVHIGNPPPPHCTGLCQ